MTGYRQFINKIWNASRFVLMHVGDLPDAAGRYRRSSELEPVHRWILHRLNLRHARGERGVRELPVRCRRRPPVPFLSGTSTRTGTSRWSRATSRRAGPSATRRAPCSLEVHDAVLRLLHPIIPFVTEELWQKLPRRAEDGRTVTLAPFPAYRAAWVDDQAVADIDSAPGDRHDDPDGSRRAGREAVGQGERDDRGCGRAGTRRARARCRLRALAGGAVEPRRSRRRVAVRPDLVTRLLREMRVHIDMPHGDHAAELAKLHRKLEEQQRRAGHGSTRQLANEDFVAKAPAAVVEADAGPARPPRSRDGQDRCDGQGTGRVRPPPRRAVRCRRAESLAGARPARVVRSRTSCTSTSVGSTNDVANRLALAGARRRHDRGGRGADGRPGAHGTHVVLAARGGPVRVGRHPAGCGAADGALHARGRRGARGGPPAGHGSAGRRSSGRTTWWSEGRKICGILAEGHAAQRLVAARGRRLRHQPARRRVSRRTSPDGPHRSRPNSAVPSSAAWCSPRRWPRWRTQYERPSGVAGSMLS